MIIKNDYEFLVLGTILEYPRYIPTVINSLKPEDFEIEINKVLFEIIREIVSSSSFKEIKIDIVTVLEKLKEKGYEHFDDLVVKYINYACDSEEILEKAIKKIKENSILRKLLKLSDQIREKSNFLSASNLLEEVEKAILEINLSQTENKIRKVGEIIDEIVDALSKRREYREKNTIGIPTGYKKLDILTSGFRDTDLIIIAARPSMGKTAFALSLMYNMARENYSILFFSLEMGIVQIVERLLAQASKVPLKKIREGKLNDKEFEKILKAVEELRHLPIYIDDTAGLNIFEIRSRARKQKIKNGLDIVFIDYLQLIQGSGRYDSRQQEVAEISGSLKTLAKELEIPVVALSQLSRQVEQRSNKRPQLSDLRESGAIEQDADLVMFIHREDFYKNESTSETESIAEILLEKHRNGPTGVVKLRFIKPIARFEDFQEEDMFEDDNEDNEIKNLSIENLDEEVPIDNPTFEEEVLNEEDDFEIDIGL